MKHLLLFALLCCTTAALAQRTLSGTATDARTGQPLEGATIAILNGPSAITDASGRFSLPLPKQRPAIVQASFLGYAPSRDTLRKGTSTRCYILVSLLRHSQLDAMIQRLCRVVVCSAVAIVGATAEQSREDWLKELSVAYAKQESFIVTYTSQGEGRSLEVTIGMDQRAGLTLLHMIGKKDGQVHEVKQWNTPDDHFYLHAPAGLVRVDGVTNETRQLSKVLSAFNDLVTGKANPPLTWHPHISMLLNTKTVAMDMGFNKNSETM